MNISKTVKPLTGLKFNKLTVGEISGRNKGGFLLYECACECGGKISATSDHLKRGMVKSCGCLKAKAREKRSQQIIKDYSKLINLKYNKLTIIKIDGSKNKFGHTLCTCECDCGTIKEVELSLVVTNQLKSCGCYRLEVVKSKIGEKHVNWNPNKTDSQRLEEKVARKNNLQFKKWSKEVKQRDKFICQICENNSRKLVSHHLNCWANFEEQRYDLENGVCLCENCHRLFHKKYGLKTTKEDFVNFINFIKNN